MGSGLVRYSVRASITLNQLAGQLRPKSEGARGRPSENADERSRDRRDNAEGNGGPEIAAGECQLIE